MDILIQNQAEQLAILRTIAAPKTRINESLRDIVPDPLDSLESVEALNSSIEDSDDFKEKLVCINFQAIITSIHIVQLIDSLVLQFFFYLIACMTAGEFT